MQTNGSNGCHKSAVDYSMLKLTPDSARNTTPKEYLMSLVGLRVVSKYVTLLSTLGIADHVGDSPVHISDLAKKLNYNEPSLYRMMACLAAYGIFTEMEGQKFAHNEVSKEYCNSEFNSLMLHLDTTACGHGYAEVGCAITSNEIPFNKANGVDFWGFMAKHPKDEENFQKGVACFTQFQANIPNIYDFSPYSTVCEVAGGRGLFLKSILAKNPKASGILFDLPSSEQHIFPELKAEFKDRFQFVGGSFFEGIKCNADIYTITETLHDFDDAAVVKILKNIAEAMKRSKSAKLLIVEGDFDLVKPNEPHFLRYLDNNMMCLFNARERTSEEWKVLTAAASLVVKKRVPIPPFFVGIECELA